MLIFKHIRLMGKMIKLVFGGRVIKSLWRFIRSFFEANKVDRESAGSAVKVDPTTLKFDEVAENLGYQDESSLQGRLLELRIEFWVFFLTFMVSILFLFFNARFGAMAMLGAASVMLLAGARVMISSYRAWNITSRKIHSFRDWVGNPEVWVP